MRDFFCLKRFGNEPKTIAHQLRKEPMHGIQMRPFYINFESLKVEGLLDS